jgi:putative transposase
VCHKRVGYPSDLTNAQWAIIKGLAINKQWGPGRPMQLDLRAVINAILYVLRTGCQWRYLPGEYPNYNSLYYHYHKWCWDGTWEKLNTALRERVRRRAGRKARPSLAIIDSQSVSTTEVGGEHGLDGAKRLNGRKRHILVDTMGNLRKVLSHAANIGERAGGKALLLDAPGWLWQRLEKILADEGDAGQDFETWVKQTFDVELDIAQPAPDQKGFVPLPIRWGVERTLAWLGRYRRLSKDYEHLTENSEGLVYLASATRLLKRLAPAYFSNRL